MSKSFCSTLPRSLSSSAALESLHAEAKTSSFGQKSKLPSMLLRFRSNRLNLAPKTGPLTILKQMISLIRSSRARAPPGDEKIKMSVHHCFHCLNNFGAKRIFYLHIIWVWVYCFMGFWAKCWTGWLDGRIYYLPQIFALPLASLSRKKILPHLSLIKTFIHKHSVVTSQWM